MDGYPKVAALLKKEVDKLQMRAVCIDCNSNRGEGRELRVMTQTRQIAHHKHFHPDHIIEIIEKEDYIKFGFTKYTGQKSFKR
jgi:hypothetical protein